MPSGTKWSCCDVGASKPEGFGGRYAWGETEEKTEYTKENYLITEGIVENYIPIDSVIQKENHKGECVLNISGTDYDVAHVKWGDGWRMPTDGEIQELLDDCVWERLDAGCLVTGPNGNSIFFLLSNWSSGDYSHRSANAYVYGEINEEGIFGFWPWTASDDDIPLLNKGLYVYYGEGRWIYNLVESGMPVRPVK